MESIEKILKILGDDNRFKIVKLLLNHDLCVGAIAYHLAISKPAVSQHLQILRKAGLVKGEKRGYWTHYMVERNMLEQVAQVLMDMAQQPVCTNGNCVRMPSDENNKDKIGGNENV
jgi:ArsR family transcriptional regulator